MCPLTMTDSVFFFWLILHDMKIKVKLFVILFFLSLTPLSLFFPPSSFLPPLFPPPSSSFLHLLTPFPPSLYFHSPHPPRKSQTIQTQHKAYLILIRLKKSCFISLIYIPCSIFIFIFHLHNSKKKIYIYNETTQRKYLQ